MKERKRNTHLHGKEHTSGHHHDHGHGHTHGRACDCEHEHLHEHGHAHGEEEGTLRGILIGAGLFAAAVLLKLVLGYDEYSRPLIAVLVAAYLILGHGVLKEAAENILHGELMDENFLMSIATLAAFAIRNYPEAVGVMLFFRVGEAFEDLAVERSRKQIMDAVDLRPETVTLAGSLAVIPAAEAKIGDIFLLMPGDRVPLDGTVVKGESFLDTSAVTGEPVPAAVSAGSSIFSGCVNTSGVLEVRADKALGDSMVSRILKSVEQAAENKPQIDHFITRFARIYTPVVVGIAILTAVGIPLVTGQAFKPWIYTAVSFLVMSCPCALVISVPLAFFCGIGAASGRGILFKGGSAMEALADIRTAVLDKTGTLTEGNFKVQEVCPSAEGLSEEKLLALAAACEAYSRHPIAASIRRESEARGAEAEVTDAAEEISGHGIRAYFGDTAVLCGRRDWLEECGVAVGEVLSGRAGTEVHLAQDGRYLGALLISDTLKPDAVRAVSELKNMGLRTAILTGDSSASARAVAAAVGADAVYAGLLPEEKENALEVLRAEYGAALFVGDGINDAPVLAGADVGAAMGSGADAAIEAADLVFMNSEVSAIPEAIRLARKAVSRARENVVFALVIKFAVMLLGITGFYSNMWLAVFADTGVAMLCILNSVRLLRR